MALPTTALVTPKSVEMIALCKQGRLKEALHILHLINQHGIYPDSSAYASLLQGCLDNTAIPEAKLVHAHVIMTGFQANPFLGTKFVVMYAKCGSLMDARRFLNKMPEQNVVSWTAVIAAYAKHGHAEEALKLFYQMRRTGIQPNQFTFASILPACANLATPEHGKEMHEDIIRSGYQFDVFVGGAVVDMYVKCDNIEKARQAFDKMPERNVVSWTAMITAYARHGYSEEALTLFYQMQQTGIRPNQFTFASVLPACANLAALEHGKKVHEDIIRSGFQCDVFVGGALVDMYAKCGIIADARNVFDHLPEQNVVSCTAMIAGYAQNGYGVEALTLFYQMQRTGIQPNQFTFTSVLAACANFTALEYGREVHEDIIRNGYLCDVFVGSALVDMYIKCGSVEDACNVFNKLPERNVVSWTAMITGYAQNGHVDDALKLFQEIPERDAVSWTAMIAGYVQNGHFKEALKVFQQMLQTGMKRNSVTFASVLPACAHLAALEHGKEVHDDIIRNGFHGDIFVGNALVDMYAKCGSIETARKVFDIMPERAVVSWNTMILGYAMHGYGREALQLFEHMQYSSTKPNNITLVGVLSACCHAGLVDEGWQYFHRMSGDYNITPSVEHYCCMVDLLGRAGCLDEAEEFINKMPIKPDTAVWGSLLGACRIHTNIELGERVAKRLFDSNPESAAHYVLMSNIYAAAGRWDDVENVRKVMKDRRVKKIPGCSWIEVNKKMYAFFVGDKSHPQTQEIYAELERLSGQLKEVGYVPETNFVLHHVEEEQKEHVLCLHSEKLAIAFGLINTSPGLPIRIIKNLRVCGDCHSAIKFISKIVERDIIVRDNNRFHHFKDGWCSCGDYW
eukprot:Gb_25125 [translate_table: standard]